MPRTRVSSPVSSPSVDVTVNMGHPFLNRTVDVFWKIGGVGVGHAGASESFRMLTKGSSTQNDLETTFNRMRKEGLQWGVVAGIYASMEYGMEKVRGRHDWKNACLGGAVTGALLIFGESRYSRDRVIQLAITGAALATASEFIRDLT